MKEGFVPAKFKTPNSKIIPAIVRAKVEISSAKMRSLESQTPTDQDTDSKSIAHEEGTLSVLTKVIVAGRETDA